MQTKLPSAELIDKLHDKTATIGVIGLGYVGLPLILRYAEVGYPVVGFDIEETKVKKLLSGQSYVEHIPNAAIQALSKQQFEATTDFAMVSKLDAIILCLPTPLNKYREPDLSYIEDTMTAILPYVRAGQVLSLESTTYPGTTDELLKPGTAGLQISAG